MHKKQIIYRDLKINNIFYKKKDQEKVFYLADFDHSETDLEKTQSLTVKSPYETTYGTE